MISLVVNLSPLLTNLENFLNLMSLQVMDEEKMDSLTLEVDFFLVYVSRRCGGFNLLGKNDFTHFLYQYTYLLTSQLENQRLYFQEKITQIEKDAAEQVST